MGDHFSERNGRYFPESVSWSSVVAWRKVAPAMARKWTDRQMASGRLSFRLHKITHKLDMVALVVC